jgi:hypothetical protein
MRYNFLCGALMAAFLSATAGAFVSLSTVETANSAMVPGTITIDIHEFRVKPNDQYQLGLLLPAVQLPSVDVLFAGHLPKIHSDGVMVWLSYMDKQGHTFMTTPQLLLPTEIMFQGSVPSMAMDVMLHVQNPWDKQVVINQAKVALIPAPDPATLGLLAVGGIVLVAWRRR